MKTNYIREKKKKPRGKKILIWRKEKNKKISNFFKAFFKRKNKHALIRKFNPILNKKNYHHPTFIHKFYQFIFSTPYKKLE